MSTTRASVLLAASALYAIACSDAVPPAAEGAYTAKFVQKPGSCSIGTHNAAVGAADANNYGLIKDGTAVPDPISGQVAPADVTCIVIDEGGRFYAEGVIRHDDGAHTLKFAVADLTPDATEDNPALGKVAFRSKTTLDEFGSPAEEPCKFWFVPGSRQQVAAGRMWVTFQCDSIVSGGRECQLGDQTMRNTIAVQNCDQ